jgi:thiamine pyrophosphate-dependent acetolactate synthase large subunit-like protein
MDAGPINGLQLARALVDACDERTVIVDDSQAFGGYLKRYVPFRRPGSLHGSMASHLGWALPAAAGVQLARPDARVLALVSDGSFLLSVQTLVTAASSKSNATESRARLSPIGSTSRRRSWTTHRSPAARAWTPSR